MNALYLSVVLATALAGAVPPDTTAPAKAAGPDALPAGALARLGTTHFRPGQYVGAAALSADGKLVVAATNQNMVLLDAQTGDPVRTISAVFGAPQFLAFTPDGKTLVRVDFGNNVRLWDVASGAQRQSHILTQPGRNLQVASASLSADGKYLVVAFRTFGQQQGGLAIILDIASGKQVASLEVLHNQQVGAALSADGKRLATWGQFFAPGLMNQDANCIIQLWDVKTAKEIRKLQVEGVFHISGAAFSPDGKLLAVAAGQSTLSIWDTASGKELHRFARQRGFNSVVQFSPDGKQLAVGTSDGAVLVWDAKTWKRIGTSEVAGCRVTSLAFPAPSRVLACSIKGQAICLWEALSGKLLSPAGGHRSGVTGIAFASDGKSILSASQDFQVHRWDRTTGKEIGHFLLQDEKVLPFGLPVPRGQVTLSSTGRYAATQTNMGDNSIRLWDLASGKVLCDLEGPLFGLGAVSFSADGRLLAALSSMDQTLLIWDADSGEMVRRLPTGGQRGGIPPSHVALSPTKRLVAASIQTFNPGPTTKLHCWRLDTGKEIFTVDQGGQVSPLVFSPDGKLLAAASGQDLVLYETAQGKERRRFQGKAFSTHLAFSPDGRTLAGSWMSPDGKNYGIQVWEWASGDLRLHAGGHKGTVLSLAYSADGQVLASGSADTTILLWDMTGRSLAAKGKSRKAEELWDDLASPKANVGFQAMAELMVAPEAALKLFKDHLKPVKHKAADPKQIATLIADLDAPRFGVREKANRELQRLGPLAGSALQERLKKDITPELRRRIEKLLERLDPGAVSNEELREMRAVEVLEHLGTPEARKLLTSLAHGAPGDVLTREAQAAQQRLEDKR
jgi:WD40 repeat protein